MLTPHPSSNSNPPKVYALVVAAGKGTRFGSAIPKQYTPIELGDELPRWCVLQHTLAALVKADELIDSYTLVVAQDDVWINQLSLPITPDLVIGGDERWQSVAKGVLHIAQYADDDDLIVIHDAARPCLGVDELKHIIACAAQEPNGAVLGVLVSDTLKQVNNGYITSTTDRSQLWQAQTPQVFRVAKLLQALDFVQHQTDMVITDEAMAFECLKLPVRMVAGKPSNIKLTCALDLPLITAILRQQYLGE